MFIQDLTQEEINKLDDLSNQDYLALFTSHYHIKKKEI